MRNMRNPLRTTIAFDYETAEIFERLKNEKQSQSEIVRNALKMYYHLKDLGETDFNKIKVYMDMLSNGEHVILDLDHLITLLDLIEENRIDDFWERHRRIAKSHAEQFAEMEIDEILKRLETCNFFRLKKSEKEFVLVFGNERLKKFVRTFLEEIMDSLSQKFEIKDEITKLRILL
jgi:hypothetical protein